MAKNISPGPLLGLLAMFGAAVDGKLPTLGTVTKSRQDRPAHIVEYLKARAVAKRKRRAANPHATTYARSNGA